MLKTIPNNLMCLHKVTYLRIEAPLECGTVVREAVIHGACKHVQLTKQESSDIKNSYIRAWGEGDSRSPENPRAIKEIQESIVSMLGDDDDSKYAEASSDTQLSMALEGSPHCLFSTIFVSDAETVGASSSVETNFKDNAFAWFKGKQIYLTKHDSITWSEKYISTGSSNLIAFYIIREGAKRMRISTKVGKGFFKDWFDSSTPQ